MFIITLPWQVEIRAGIAAVFVMDQVPAGGIAEEGLSGQQGTRGRGPHVGDRCGDSTPASRQDYTLETALHFKRIPSNPHQSVHLDHDRDLRRKINYPKSINCCFGSPVIILLLLISLNLLNG